MKRTESKEQLVENREQFAGGRRRVLETVRYLLFAIFYLLFVVACSIEAPRTEIEPFSDGYGTFTLQLADSTARTVLPDTPEMDEFEVFRLIFTPNPADQGEARTVDYVNLKDGIYELEPVILVAGTYDLVVQAYRTSVTPVPANLAAQSDAVAVTIIAGGSETRSITLRALLTSGNGTFSWDIAVNTVSTTVTQATMTIVNSGGITQEPVVTLTTDGAANTGNRSLPAGIYTVNFSLAGHEPSDEAMQRAIVWSELLYVYSALESRFPKTGRHTFNDDHFNRTHWKVTLTYDNGRGNNLQELEEDPTAIATAMQSVMHGDTIDNVNFIPIPINPTRKGFLFGGWFRNEEGTGTAWILDDPVHEDIHLYAKWTPNTAAITLTLEDIVNPTPVYDTPVIISHSGTPISDPPSEFLVEVSGTGITNYKWEVKGIGVYPDILAQGATMTSFTLNVANNSYNTIGGHILKLTVTAGSRDYVLNIPFNVIN